MRTGRDPANAEKAELIEQVLQRLLERDLVSASSNLRQNWPSSANPERLSRGAFSFGRQLDVFQRDRVYCRYCQNKTIFLGSLGLITRLIPEVFPCHPNWKFTDTHPAYLILSATLDHVVPVARGGTDDPSNIATACWRCNSIKGAWLLDEIRWTLNDAPPEPWDGLVGLFVRCMESNSVDDKGLRSYRKIPTNHSNTRMLAGTPKIQRISPFPIVFLS